MVSPFSSKRKIKAFVIPCAILTVPSNIAFALKTKAMSVISFAFTVRVVEEEHTSGMYLACGSVIE
eukprot:scaffold302944_cov110-Attheya_sp.AAC.1